ncbi:hypothetical protein D9M68_737880 [compost metagenome]
MADQVHLGGTGLLEDLGDALEQLLATHLAGVHRRHQHRKDPGALPTERRDDAEPIGITEQTDEAEQARHQYQGVTWRSTIRHH